jgi:hypothetical protein
MAESRFGAVSALRRQQQEGGKSATAVAEPERPQETGEGEGTGTRRGPGRPAGGKRSNPDYERMNLLVRKDTRRKVDLKMLQDGHTEDLSELVDRLLRQWAE